LGNNERDKTILISTIAINIKPDKIDVKVFLSFIGDLL